MNVMWTEIRDSLQIIIVKHIPTKYTSNTFQQPWFTTTTNRLARIKKRWFQKMKQCPSERTKNKYKEIKRKTQQACRTAHADYIQNMFNDDDKNNKKKLWSYIRSKNQENVGIPDLKNNNIIIQDPKAKANLLN